MRLNKTVDGKIAYPGYLEYNTAPFNKPIDKIGVFGGNTTRPGRPDWPETVVSVPPQDSPPKVRKDEEAAWLREIYSNRLIFINEQDKVIERSRNGYQGKTSLLKVGKWYILSGTNASKRAL